MNNPINLFKTSKGQAQYFAAYDAALQLWPVNYESRFVTTPYGQTHVISCSGRCLLLGAPTRRAGQLNDVVSKYR